MSFPTRFPAIFRPDFLTRTGKLSSSAAALLFLLGWTGMPVNAHEAITTTFEKLDVAIREHPEDYAKRSERAWLMVEHSMRGAPLGEDIDTLLSKPAWREQGRRLRASHLLLQGRYREARVQARSNIKAGATGPEQYRLLAGADLALKDTAGALRAYREGWEKLRLEEDYIAMVGLSRGKRGVPDALLAEGLEAYPRSPGVYSVIFRAYLSNGHAASLRKALEVSNKGQTVLWPRSIDWKIWHAQALLAARKRDSAESVLLHAMDMLEGDTRLRPTSDIAMRLRQEIFELLDSARAHR
jgi:hypothetical protein